ncbi:MAG TPA: hypothetical protein VND70_09135 [Acidimicrobiales bacterium]|nr:hypothetical protein [Acidimicrobiales bacterium]
MSPPPNEVTFDLEEARELLIALEEGCEVVSSTDRLSVLAQLEQQLLVLTHKLGLEEGGSDAD